MSKAMSSKDLEALKASVLGGDLSPATLRALADGIEAAAQALEESKLLQVGNTVRVPRGEACVKAMVAELNGDGTVDVVYDSDAAEARVASASATALLDFETSPPVSEKDSVDAAVHCKERGSALLKCKDYLEASKHYKAALGVLKRLRGPASPRVGGGSVGRSLVVGRVCESSAGVQRRHVADVRETSLERQDAFARSVVRDPSRAPGTPWAAALWCR